MFNNKHWITSTLLTLFVFLLINFIKCDSNECKCEYCNCGGFTCNIKPNQYNVATAYCDYAPNTYVSYISVQLKSSSDKITVKTMPYSDNSNTGGSGLSGLSSSGSVSCYQGSSFMTDTSINRYITYFTCDSNGFSCTSSQFDTMSYCTDKTITVNNLLLTSDKSIINSGDLINFKTYLRDSQNSTLSTKASVSLRIENGISPLVLYNIDSGRSYFSEGGIGDFSGAMIKSKQNQTVTLLAKYVQSGKFLESRLNVNVMGDPTFNSANTLMSGGGFGCLFLILIISFIAF
ncbi:predicted protein [Naegleria gruberi]|uniref:Predicted protein n=1 Tax=Naegleria gruberi TaxID=5762 RepID=D2W3X8_NAEGR|nr:uncharacterized protein NAEGRDRAFT_76104 [Naegleria gruberi]EFC36214.1 predicted protein [Naegleria gruberi]|eukprot:XP_002668958.1 predicted protein [Naegleria gruberi strain NEG-M]